VKTAQTRALRGKTGAGDWKDEGRAVEVRGGAQKGDEGETWTNERNQRKEKGRRGNETYRV